MEMKRYHIGVSEYRLFPSESATGDFVRFEDAEAAIKAAVEAEREACAKTIENIYSETREPTSWYVAGAIRARGES